ncbi:hypothetical protein ACQWHR_24880, partial [Salmonella enterica subsp. enterica serovar Infantis]
CSLVSILMIFCVSTNRSVSEHEEIPFQSRTYFAVLPTVTHSVAQRH